MKTKNLLLAIALTSSIVSAQCAANSAKQRPPAPVEESLPSNASSANWYDPILDFFGF